MNLKLGLGTVQFGMDYGISNQNGKTSLKEVESILQFAQESGISVLDTACSYGDSESVLGMTLTSEHNFRIITKLPSFKKDKISSSDSEDLKKAFYDSLSRLRQIKVDGLLIHNADDILNKEGEILFSALIELRQGGLVEKIGVSVYTGKQIDCLLERYTFDLIQVPINVLDQRLINSGHLRKLKKKNIEIHARSIYLQGLLLMEPKSLCSFFDPIKPFLYKYRELLTSHDLIPVEGAICFIKEVPEIDYIIVGINNLEQLKNNVNSFNKKYDNNLFDEFKVFSLNEPKFLNPSLWKLQ